MKYNLDEFEKNKELLVCVDSDGCAIDTMEVKHRKCFGPKAVEIWGLENIEERFLDVWNTVNLYSKQRGINRFKGLVRTFEILKSEGMELPEFSQIQKWTQTSSELSNPALERAIEESGHKELKQTLEWSYAVNKSIKELPKDDQPFSKVKEGLELIGSIADIAIVSSANTNAVEEEWTRHGLIPYVQILLGQEAGTKATCIGGLKEHNYRNEEVLMVGDAPGDLEAALVNGALYYPILVGNEEYSWKRLASEALQKFKDGSYKGKYQEELIDEFRSTLK